MKSITNWISKTISKFKIHYYNSQIDWLNEAYLVGAIDHFEDEDEEEYYQKLIDKETKKLNARK